MNLFEDDDYIDFIAQSHEDELYESAQIKAKQLARAKTLQKRISAMPDLRDKDLELRSILGELVDIVKGLLNAEG